jgi:SAM-dependent methyltransferase
MTDSAARPDAIFTDPRLAAVYDAANPSRDDIESYLRLAGDTPIRVLDLGCGTGVLAVDLAERGHLVTGLDPAAAMLEIARRRPGGQGVRWIEADARRFALDERFDLAVMTGHAFQVFLEAEDLDAVMGAVRDHLAPGGRFAFESRNPLVRAWDDWNPDATRERLEIGGGDAVDVFYRVTDERDGLVTFETHHRFADGTTGVSPSTLRFLLQPEIAAALAEAGFRAVEWFGDWTGAPFSDASPEIIAVARVD